MRLLADVSVRSAAARALAVALPILLLSGLAGCSGGAKVTVPIKAMDLPALSADAPVDIYWSQKSVEDWLKLAGNPEKAPDLQAARLRDTHKLWENRDTGLEGAKVADLEIVGNISGKHPREWLLLDLGRSVRELGADAVVVNSIRVATPTGHQMRDDSDAMWSDGISVKVWLYAQALHYE